MTVFADSKHKERDLVQDAWFININSKSGAGIVLALFFVPGIETFVTLHHIGSKPLINKAWADAIQ